MTAPTRSRPDLSSAGPEPDAAALANSAALIGHLTDVIDAAGGWISFSAYMHLALYAPGLGYYSSGSRKFGAAGDFVTAPEISPLFSRCLASQVADILRGLGGGDILEAGAGTGIMAADLLIALEAMDALPGRYAIVEVSADLRQRQQETLKRLCPALAQRVEWLDGPPDAPWQGVVLGNEVLDALPVDCFRIGESGVEALGVQARDGGFAYAARPAPASLVAAVRAIEADLDAPLPEGCRSEVCPSLAAWIDAVTASLQRGVALFIDYGLPRRHLYLAERTEGTLACHYRHRFHDDPFKWPGLQDITAWVDFTAAARAGTAANLTPAGFTTQAQFLIACELEQHLSAAMATVTATQDQMRLAQQVRALTLPGEMGERFKVLALQRQYTAALRGFALRDLPL